MSMALFEEFMMDVTLCWCSMNTDCGVFGGWPYLAYQYIMKVVSSNMSCN